MLENVIGYEHKEWKSPIERFSNLSGWVLHILDTLHKKQTNKHCPSHKITLQCGTRPKDRNMITCIKLEILLPGKHPQLRLSIKTNKITNLLSIKTNKQTLSLSQKFTLHCGTRHKDRNMTTCGKLEN